MPDDSPLARWMSRAAPVRAACLDLAFNRLPRPNNKFALGLDRPLYYSDHSAVAKLAPKGIAVVHVMKYLGSGNSAPSQTIEHELERFLDQIQPRWNEHLVARRFLPSMTVAHGLPRADEDGLLGRPDVTVPERPGIFLASDWVGPDGLLADAAAASASEAARRVLALLTATQPVPRSPLLVRS
jgi:hypothetical protein